MPVTIDIDEKIQAASNNGYGQQKVIETSAGVLYAVQINVSNVIEVHTSINGGTSWSLDTSFSSLTAPFHLSLCISERDDIFLGFVHNTNVVVIKKRDYLAGTWSEVYNTTHSASSEQFALLTYGKALNRLYLFYTNGDNDLSNKRSDDYGSTWSAATSTGEGSGGTSFKLWSVDSAQSGNLYSIWWTSWNASIRTAVWTSAGVYSTYEGHIYNTLANMLGGQIALDSGSNRWRVFYFLDATNYKLMVDKNAVNSLTVNYSTTDTLNHGQVTIGIDNLDNVYIFYVKTADNICYYRKYTASTTSWGTETALTAGNGVRPSCVMSVRPGGTKLRIVYTTA